MKFLRRKPSPISKPVWKEWLHHIAFAVVVATLVRGLLISAYAVPTGSMEGTVRVGDRMVVSKFHYGARTPETLLQLPLMHQTILGTDIPSYLDWIQLPYFRLPGLGAVERGEPVVFHYPPEWDRPTDMKTFYVKRCVALPGDTLQLINQQVLINGDPQPQPIHYQTSYHLRTRQTIQPRVWQQHDVVDVFPTAEGYYLHAKPETATRLGRLPFVESIEPIVYTPGASQAPLYPESASSDWSWTQDFYGPVYLPRAGDQIKLNPHNTALYGPAIVHYEKVGATLIDDQLRIDGQVASQYTFRQDYYFMIGDNRHNSLDSRFWGLVPEDHIVGKPLLVWFSTDEQGDWWNKIRWNRLLMPIN